MPGFSGARGNEDEREGAAVRKWRLGGLTMGRGRFRLGLVVCIGVMLLWAVGGEEAVALTLDEALALALEKNPVLQAADFEVKARQARLGQARSALFPQIDFHEIYQRTDNPMLAVGSKLNQERFSSQDYRLERLNDPPPVGNFNSRVAVTQSVFDQGKTLLSVQQSKLLREEGVLGRERIRQEVVCEVVRAYAGVLVANEDGLLAEAALKKADAHVKLAEDLFETGRGVKSDVLLAMVRLSEVKNLALEAGNRVSVSKARLNRSMGISQDKTYEVEGALASVPEVIVPLEEMIGEALQKRPDWGGMKRRIESAEVEVKKGKSGYLPSFDVQAQYDLNDRSGLWNASGESWTVMALCRFNLFSGLSTVHRVDEARASLDRLNMEAEALRNTIELEVREGFFRRKNAEERVTVAEEAVKHAEESMRIVEDRYQVGLSLMLEVLDNEVSLTRARRNLLQAQYEYRVANAELDLARGVLR